MIEQVIDATRTQTVWFIMVSHPALDWMRAGKAYISREVAEGWAEFVSSYFGDRPTKISECVLHYVDGHLDEQSIEKLDKEYNLDPPKEAPSCKSE